MSYGGPVGAQHAAAVGGTGVAAPVGSGVAVLDPPPPPAVAEKPMPLAEVAKNAAVHAERIAIEEALHRVHWNRRKAAVQLGVSYKTLLNKIKECGISRK
jgi:DNA-binding NtrC family response regulator